MRFLFNLFCLTAALLWGGSLFPLNAQEKTISIQAQDVPLSEVLNEIEEQTGYMFVYNAGEIDADRTVSVNIHEMTLAKALEAVFESTGITYAQRGLNIMLVNKRAPQEASEETAPVRGTVMDTNGEPIIGAGVMIKGTTTGAETDLDGRFSFQGGESGTLVVSYIGYKDEEVQYTNKREMFIVMKEDTELLDEVVVVGFGTQKKESVIGAIQSVKASDLISPSTNLTSTFAGRIAGIVSVQTSGEPGADGANFWIRGVSTFASGSAQNALILIDGTEASTYDLNSLAPETIESFSVLKDATATALYGSRGANGVLLITTKSGNIGKPRINVRVESKMSMPTQIPELADGVTYMEMFNEAIQSRTPGTTPQFSSEKIEGTRAGGNPYLFPDNNWYDIIFKDITWNQSANINVSGGSKDTDYFVSATFNNDTGLINETPENELKNNIHNIRYSFQANVNTKITRTTKLGVKLNVQIQDYKGPGSSTDYIFERVMWAQPVYFPVKFPQIPGTNYTAWGNRSGGPQLNRYPNPYAELASGIKEMFRITTMATVNLDQDLRFITPGLSFKGLFSMKHFANTEITRSNTPYYFEIDPATVDYENGTYDLKAVNNDGTNAYSFSRSNTGDRLFNFNFSLNYQRVFKEKHDVSAQLIYLQRGIYSNNPSSYNASLGELNQGIAGRVTYDFDKRYFVELNFGYNGSDNFNDGHRFGFFPSYAAGYIISNEKYFERLKNVISLLKIRGSYGLVGNAYSDVRFPGYTTVNMNGGRYAFGESMTSTNAGAIITKYGNENATWEIAKKTDIGLELGLFDNKLLLIADWFYEDRDNILMTRRTLSPTIGIGNANPVANIGRVKNQGVDMSLEYNHAINKDLVLSVKGNFTYAVNEVIEKDEPHYTWAYQYEKGGPMNRIGPAYVALGLFKDEEDIAGSPDQSSIMPNVLPGDIKYADLNKDGTVNEYDRTYIGNPTIPQIVYGVGASLQYRNWDFSIFFQGAGKVSIYMQDIDPFGTYHKNVLGFVADSYWSESNQDPDATYPRLAHTTGFENNQQLSTFWLRDGSFLRLKNAEIGYTFKFMRAYLSGTNLLTFSPFKYWDPEIGGGNGLSYPLQRVVSLGLQFKF